MSIEQYEIPNQNQIDINSNIQNNNIIEDENSKNFNIIQKPNTYKATYDKEKQQFINNGFSQRMRYMNNVEKPIKSLISLRK